MKHPLDMIFRPRSVAVIGATSRKGSIGRETLHNILQAEFNGKVFPVNPSAEVIQSIKAYPSVLDIPDMVDMAIIIVRKEFVRDVAIQCGKKGVKGLVVITAGFSEVGKEGKKREQEVLAVCNEYGMRMIGPNCFGVVNTDPEINLNATFGKTYPRRGRIGFVTQSGAMGEAIMNIARDLGIGFSCVASIGNKADISSNDMLEYFKRDPNTDIILLYLENFGNPVKFTKIAREVCRIKPIVAVKSGRTSLGAKAASSHTGALAGLDVGVDALFEQTGVMRVDTVEELFDVANALSKQPVPKGNRVVVVTNAGGPGILATDALINHGMEMPALSESTVKKLKTFIPAEASFSNPMDMVAGAGPKEFKQTLDAVKNDARYDSIIPICVPPVTIDQMKVAETIAEAVSKSKKTVLACFMGTGLSSPSMNYLREHGVPVYIFPEAIAKTLSIIHKYRRRISEPCGKFKTFKVDKEKVQQIIDNARSEGRGSIVGDEAISILSAYGIQAMAYRYAWSAEEAVKVAGEMGYPVVMKINTPPILHKTEVGGVMVDLRTDKEVFDGFTSLKKRISELGEKGKFSVAMQGLITGGVETVMGMTIDPSFGPLIMFGLGGIYVEIMKDVSFRINPLTDVGADAMIHSLKSFPLLNGFRGAPPVNQKVLKETLLRLSQLVKDITCFAEIDINPFIVSPDKKRCAAVDARFILTKK
ncbi:MAG TPA: acetate--CoA ligase family protein [candidate division Zixibacteria bacterium]|nr:acetate--CoA ligase family protein [candidate division Zixibacteria bacterium]